TNPSSKYDAEGNAGIINIKLKRDKNLGANATVNLGFQQGIFPKFNGSISGNYRSKKLNIFGSYGANAGIRQSRMVFNRTQTDVDSIRYDYDIGTEMYRDMVNHNIRLGADYTINSKNTIGFLGNGFIQGGTWESRSRTEISPNGSDNLISLLTAESMNENSTTNLSGNINYKFDGGNGTTFNVDADYGRFRSVTDGIQPNLFVRPSNSDTLSAFQFGSEAPTTIDIYTFKADYERTLGKGKLGFGGKTALVTTDNDFNFFNYVDGAAVLDSVNSRQFLFDETINALYANYQTQIGKWGIQAGLRGEHTISKGDLVWLGMTAQDTVDRNYFNLFPSGGITYSPNRINTFRFTYSRRIDRPRYQDLNPFQNRLSAQSYQQGNPLLLPQYSHNIEIGHTYKYTLNYSLSFSQTDDYFTAITDTADGDATFLTTENIATRRVGSFNVSYPKQITKWWSTFTNISASFIQVRSFFEEGKDIDIDRFTGNLYHQSTFRLPADFSIQMGGWIASPGIWGANYLTDWLGSFDIGMQKSLMKKRAQLKVALSDVFFTSPWRATQVFGDLDVWGSGRWESRMLKVNFTWLLGNSQVKKARKRKTGLEDEKGRTGGGSGGIGG
ncbi:MAG: outer membrane beta-barrel family protein, partial [Bacteroidota bacterium]